MRAVRSGGTRPTPPGHRGRSAWPGSHRLSGRRYRWGAKALAQALQTRRADLAQCRAETTEVRHYRSLVLLLDLLQQLAAEHRHLARGSNPDAYLHAIRAEHHDLDVLTDQDALT